MTVKDGADEKRLGRSSHRRPKEDRDSALSASCGRKNKEGRGLITKMSCHQGRW